MIKTVLVSALIALAAVALASRVDPIKKIVFGG